MKLKKIVTFIITAAAAAACSAALFSVQAGAFAVPKYNDDPYYYSNGSNTYAPVNTLAEYLRNMDNLYYKNGNDYIYDTSGNNARSAQTEFVLDGSDGNYILNTTDLAALNNKINQFTTIKTSTLNTAVAGDSVQYEVYLKRNGTDYFFNNTSRDYSLGGVNFSMAVDATSYPGTLKIGSNAFNSGYTNMSLYYHIPANDINNSQLKNMLKLAGVDTSDRVRVYTVSSDGNETQTTAQTSTVTDGTNTTQINVNGQAADGDQTEYTLKFFEGNDTGYDLNITLTNAIPAYYYTAYDKSSMSEYLKSNEAADYLSQKLPEILGFDPAELSSSAELKAYIDAVKEELFEKDSDGNYVLTDHKYVSKNEIDQMITDYYTKKNDAGTDYSDTTKQHLEELAKAIVASDPDNDEMLKKYIYEVFGLNTSGGVVSVISDTVNQSIVEAVLKNLTGTNTLYTGYKDAIKYYYSEEGYKEVQQLHDALVEINNKTIADIDSNGNSVKYNNLSDLLEELNKYKNYLKTNNITDVSLSNLIDDAATAAKTASANTLTLTQLLSTLSAYDAKLADLNSNLSDYAKKDGNINTSNINDYISDYTKDYVTEKDLNSYITYSEFSKLLQNQGVAYRSEINSLTNQLNTLNAELTKLQENYDALKKYNPYLYDNYYYNGYYYNGQYYNLSDWAVARYGSLDNFMNAVTNEVIRKLGTSYSTNGTSGESAYDIAVRNGFKGTEKAWLNSLVGASAYDIAVQNGFTGSETAWLNSLRGADGKDGVDGKDGKDGRDGVDGRDGRDGADGKDGKDGTSSTTAESTGRVVYVYGNRASSAAPEADTTPDKSVNDTAAYINGNTTNSGTKTAAAVSNVTAPAAGKTANPSTGVAAGIIIPAAAAASLFLAKKDKRKRGRK